MIYLCRTINVKVLTDRPHGVQDESQLFRIWIFQKCVIKNNYECIINQESSAISKAKICKSYLMLFTCTNFDN